MRLAIGTSLLVLLSILSMSCDRDGGISAPFQVKSQNLAPDDEACGFSLNIRKQRISWKQKTKFFMDKSCPTEFKASVEASIQYWNKVIEHRDGQGLFEFAGDIEAHQLPNNHDGKNVVSCGPIESKDGSQKQGITSLKIVGRDIVNADILLDISKFCFTDLDNPESVKACDSSKKAPADLQSVMNHEFGHALGLGHSHDEESLMYPQLRYGQSRREVSTNDYKNIKCEY